MEWEGELQTAIVSFENDAGVQLNLVAAVHLGEEEYYAELNDYFRTQDVVLYELVAEPNQVPVRGGIESSTSFIGFIQQAMAEFLNIGFQLDEIDYTQPNFLHADLTPSQFDELMDSKNENFFTTFLNLAMAQMAEQNASPDDSLSSFNMLSLMSAINSENQNAALKFLFAQELGRSGGVIVDEGWNSSSPYWATGTKRPCVYWATHYRIQILDESAYSTGLPICRESSVKSGLRWASPVPNSDGNLPE
jgi:hypothetical protein